jgi:Uma2 family endonuclease
MGEPSVPALHPAWPGLLPPPVPEPPSDLPETDEVPMETPWHRNAMNQLLDCVAVHRRRQGRPRYYAGGNMFLYFSREQVRNKDYAGPDFFFVEDVDPARPRDYWAIWDEAGRYPNVIVELISATTAEHDRTFKKNLYERTFRTPEYFLFDPFTGLWEGWRMTANSRYAPVAPDERGWFWSEQLGLWLGTWEGDYQRMHATYPRFYDAEGRLVPRPDEEERQRAEEARRQADEARAELEELRRQLAALRAGQQPPAPPS